MSTPGGFILDTSQELEAGPSRSSVVVQSNVSRDEEEHDSVTARKLTSKQEVRLMNYLDEAFMQINRGYNKRLDSFLKAYDSILAVIASIPPIGPSATLLVSYLLRLTSELLDGIIGYEVSPGIPERNDDQDESEANGGGAATTSPNEQLQNVISHLSFLDKVWSCVLRGHLVDVKAVKKNVELDSQKDFTDDYFPKEFSGREDPNEMQGINGSKSLSAGRYPPTLAANHIRESRIIIGSKGFSTVGQTDRIRLRNVIILGKENIFSWMRIQLDEPLPPKVDANDDDKEEEEREGNPPDKQSIKMEQEEFHQREVEEGEEDLEEVNTDQQRVDLKEKSHKNSHFDDLFARKIDPDASDSEDDDKDKEEGITSPPLPSPKRQRRRRDVVEEEEEEEEVRQDSPKEAESIATFSGTAAVMKWDIKFARLFANTLRCLSDIQEYDNHKEASRKTDNGKD